MLDATHTLLTWTGSNGTHFVVKAELIDSGHTARVASLSPADSDSVLGAASVTADRAMVLWRSNTVGADPATGGAPRVSATLGHWASDSSGDFDFGQAEAISAPGDLQPVLTGLVDPVTGRAIAAWAPVSSPVEFAVRPAN